MQKLIIGLLVMGILGCSPKVQTIEYYMAHEAEAKQVKQKCETDNTVLTDKNCFNANLALSKIQQQQMQDSMAHARW